jgi:uncharacterized coiled-coil DUF342 family protein
MAGGRAEIHRRLFQEKKEERDALLKKVRELKRKKLEEEARLSELRAGIENSAHVSISCDSNT